MSALVESGNCRSSNTLAPFIPFNILLKPGWSGIKLNFADTSLYTYLPVALSVFSTRLRPEDLHVSPEPDFWTLK